MPSGSFRILGSSGFMMPSLGRWDSRSFDLVGDQKQIHDRQEPSAREVLEIAMLEWDSEHHPVHNPQSQSLIPVSKIAYQILIRTMSTPKNKGKSKMND